MKKRGKKGRPRSENPMVHTAVVLPRDLLERLRTDGEQSARGLSTEIRQRLLATYGTEGQRDAKTTELTDSIQTLADTLDRYLGKPWHESDYGRSAMAGGIFAFLGPLSGTRDIPGHTDNPETVGRVHARQIMAARHEAVEPEHERENE